MHDHPTVVVSPTIDEITVDEAHHLLLRLKAEGTPVDIAAEVTAEFIAVMLEEYPPIGRAA